jgi:hypothetical protein
MNSDVLQLQFGPNASFRNVDCALRRLKGVTGLEKMGFVGSEAYVKESN